MLLSKRWQQKLPQLTEQEVCSPLPAHPGALAHTFSFSCQNSRPPSPSCPQLHLLLPSEADPHALLQSCLLPEKVQLRIPEGARSRVHALKKSRRTPLLNREASEEKQRLILAGRNSMAEERFSTNPKCKLSGDTRCIPHSSKVFHFENLLCAGYI